MTSITSRKNSYIAHVKALSSDTSYRKEHGEFICDSIKLLKEANAAECEITSILWKETAERFECNNQYIVPSDLFDYVSPLKNSKGPLFTVRIKPNPNECFSNAVILENVQDPGNVGTVIRTANALGIDKVILVGQCADLYNPKTVRATMGAIFRQSITECSLDSLDTNGLPVYGAVLADDAVSIKDVNMSRCAVAIGSEGNGLSREMIDLCDKKIIIPMKPGCESLNASVAASICMWEIANA